MPAFPHTPEELARQAAVDELNLWPLQAEGALDRVTSLLARLCGAPMAALLLLDGEHELVVSGHGLPTQPVPRGASFSDAVVAQDGLLEVADASTDPRLCDNPLVQGATGVRGCAALPVRMPSGIKVGALCVFHTGPLTLDRAARADLEHLRLMVEDRLRLSTEVVRDARTGTYTRRHFVDLADREWRRSMRGLVSNSVILASLDQVDDFLTAEGEEALARGMRAAGLAMQYTLHRPGDCTCRWDATHLAMLLPGTDELGAREAAERVRLALGALLIPFRDSAQGVLTLSQGIETVPCDLLARVGLDEALAGARVALIEAQREGGNRWKLSEAAAERARRASARATGSA